MVTDLSGNSLIGVNTNDNLINRLPHMNDESIDSDFSSFNGYLEISFEELQAKMTENKLKSTEKPFLYIEVLSL